MGRATVAGGTSAAAWSGNSNLRAEMSAAHNIAIIWGITPQTQPGKRSVGLCVPMGRMNPDQMDAMAWLSELYGDGRIRFTTGQNAIIPNVKEAKLDSLLEEDLAGVPIPAFKFAPRRGGLYRH